jgi:hypothetical protein
MPEIDLTSKKFYSRMGALCVTVHGKDPAKDPCKLLQFQPTSAQYKGPHGNNNFGSYATNDPQEIEILSKRDDVFDEDKYILLVNVSVRGEDAVITDQAEALKAMLERNRILEDLVAQSKAKATEAEMRASTAELKAKADAKPKPEAEDLSKATAALKK